jgi:hypothetical protein
MLFGKKQAYAKEVMKANLERLYYMIKVCDFPIQTKVCLFWQKEKEGICGRCRQNFFFIYLNVYHLNLSKG